MYEPDKKYFETLFIFSHLTLYQLYRTLFKLKLYQLYFKEKISLIWLVFIFGLVTKGDDTGSLAKGIYLLAHSAFFSFLAFLKNDARGDSIIYHSTV